MKTLYESLSSKSFLVAGLIIMLFVIIFFALKSDKDISYDQIGLSINSNFKNEAQRLQKEMERLKRTTVSKAKYERLFQQIKKLEQVAVDNGLLLKRHGEKEPEEIIESLKTMITETRNTVGDIQVSMSLIERELRANKIINTKQNINNTVRKLNYHIQKVLAVLGEYNGKCDGTRESTSIAMIDFQNKHGLRADGILGTKTWSSISRLYRSMIDEG